MRKIREQTAVDDRPTVNGGLESAIENPHRVGSSSADRIEYAGV
jgi:hypothetical protein